MSLRTPGTAAPTRLVANSVVRRYSDKRVLVTGASGFIGAHLCAALADAGAEVHGASRRSAVMVQPGGRSWMVDLADPTATDALVDAVRPHVVFHLAAHVTGRREAAEVRPSVLNTLLASVNVLSSVTRVGCDRLVMAGSMEEPDTGISEAVAASPYAAAKWAASSHARMFHALHGTPAVILRLFMVYGPGQHDRTKLVPYVITSLLRGERPQVTSGSRLVDWVFVDDVVRAFIAAGAVSGVEGSTVDIGSGRTVTVRKVVESLIDLVDPDLGADFGAVPERPGEGSRAADVARAAATLGWHPSVVLEEGLAQTLRWYRQRDDGRGQLRSKIGSGR